MQTKTIQSMLRTSAIIMGCGAAASSTLPQIGCSSTPELGGRAAPADKAAAGSSPVSGATTGEVSLQLTLPGGQGLTLVSWTITGPNGASTLVQSGSVNLSNANAINFLVGGIAAGSGYTISLSGTSTDGTVTCVGSATFAVTGRATTTVVVPLQCSTAAADAGSALINGSTYNCASISSVAVSPTETAVGTSSTLTALATGPNPSGLTYAWSAPSGTFSASNAANTTFTCTVPGVVTLTLTAGDGALSDGGSCPATSTTTVQVTCEVFAPSSLVVSSSTYTNAQGAVASLAVGTTLPGASGAFATDGGLKTPATTVTAVAGNDYVNVWNNAPVDGSFGVTSPIQLADINPTNGQVFNTISVPTSQVVTSFSSKSELGLHFAVDGSGLAHVVFVAYAGAPVGALDVSNSDAVPGQDPTNPVTALFGSSYAFARTIVSLDALGNLTYTPTINYGGNNGRNALLAPNGLYYSVGNANNGGASTFGLPNSTNPNVTETTGLEVVNPINGSSSDAGVPASNSAEVDPLIQYEFVDGGLVADGGTVDKAGKDNNYRGVTQYNGALYFTKGSGSNGIQTVYTVPSLPTVANAASQTIGIVPGFPTDSAKVTGGNYTPFAVFFANATTMYVTDEGSGNATDVESHAGLQKWSLVGSTWQLDYVLTAGLIGTGTTDNLTGSDGPWPPVTTFGLRNMDGVVNQAAGTVTLWAVTSTSSTSGDNGADPNKVVTITDQISATTLPAGESFSVVTGPTYGTVYRGVAYVP